MTIHLNTHPDERKDMVKAISELTGLGSTYMGMPSCAYQIGGVTVNRDGTLDYESDTVAEGLIPMLIERGWLDPAEYELGSNDSEAPEPAVVEAPTDTEATITEPSTDNNPMAIHLPMTDWTVPQAKNLLRLVCKNQYLLRRMTGGDTLQLRREFVEELCAKDDYTCIAGIQKDLDAGMERGDVCGMSFEDDHFMMIFPDDAQDPNRWHIMTELMDGMMRMAQAATRVSLDSKATQENEKFYAHSWLLRMGFGGPEHKALRATLLGHLNGYAAFKSADAMKAHTTKYAALRKEHQEVDA